MFSSGRMFLHSGRLIQKMLVNEELVIILRQQIKFDRNQKAAGDQPHNWLQLTDRTQLTVSPPLLYMYVILSP